MYSHMCVCTYVLVFGTDNDRDQGFERFAKLSCALLSVICPASVRQYTINKILYCSLLPCIITWFAGGTLGPLSRSPLLDLLSLGREDATRLRRTSRTPRLDLIKEQLDYIVVLDHVHIYIYIYIYICIYTHIHVYIHTYVHISL